MAAFHVLSQRALDYRAISFDSLLDHFATSEPGQVGQVIEVNVAYVRAIGSAFFNCRQIEVRSL